MPSPSPYVREAGAGPGVVCIHSNASSSAQWRGLMESLSPSHLVLAPDSFGSGQSPDWHSDRVITLRDEVDLIEPVLARAGTPLALVGHSYGAAVALMAALSNPGPVRALAIHESTLFAVVDAQAPLPNGADGILDAVRAAGEALDMPVLYMLGASSPESAYAVARLLVPVLPQVQVVEFPGLGHMAPVTHPQIVNAAIARILGEP